MKTTRVPVVRQTSWPMAIAEIAVLVILIVISFVLFGKQNPYWSILFPTLLFLAYSYGSRWILLRHNRLGMGLIRQNRYQEAVEYFQKSYDFFSQHAWLDRYRFLSMMNPSLIAIREIALLNIGYSYAQLGDKTQTKAAYERVLEEFPDSIMAQNALNFMRMSEAG